MRIIAVAFLFVCLCLDSSYSRTPFYCTVTKIVDGDTIYCTNRGGIQKIRLIGIDAPESSINTKAYKDSKKTGQSIETIKKMGKKSKEFVISRVPIGTRVELEFDIQVQDRYRRTLAYIYLPDETMLNDLIVKEGFAQVATYPPNVRYQKIFLQSQKEAREERKGLWSSFEIEIY